MDRDPRLFLQDIENIYVTDEFVPTTTNEPTNERNERKKTSLNSAYEKKIVHFC